MPTIAEANWDRWEAGLRAEGVEQGQAAGRARLGRQASLRFGARTGERLLRLMEELAGGEALDQVGDWIIECGSGEELLSRVSALLAKAGNGPPN